MTTQGPAACTLALTLLTGDEACPRCGFLASEHGGWRREKARGWLPSGSAPRQVTPRVMVCLHCGSEGDAHESGHEESCPWFEGDADDEPACIKCDGSKTRMSWDGPIPCWDCVPGAESPRKAARKRVEMIERARRSVGDTVGPDDGDWCGTPGPEPAAEDIPMGVLGELDPAVGRLRFYREMGPSLGRRRSAPEPAAAVPHAWLLMGQAIEDIPMGAMVELDPAVEHPAVGQLRCYRGAEPSSLAEDQPSPAGPPGPGPSTR